MSMYYCPHCERKLSKTLYFQHKSVFFASKEDFLFIEDGPASFDSETEDDVDFKFSDPDTDASMNQGK